ncbi:MAG: TonB-dependent receptor [Bryobacterales bacterium]|nr:TonB-dependent receptor [Bryobacterales bacterium]
MNRSIEFLRLIALVLCCEALLVAQTTFGVIRGRVLDATGAAVTRATVVVTNTATGIARTFTTNESGAYEAGYLQPGTYSVSAEASGFKKFVADGIILNATAIVLVDAKLEVGDITTSVTVEAGAPLISTESAVISDVKTAQQYLQAPMNVRGNWDSFLYNFMSLVPGAQPTINGFSISFAGTRYTMNNFTVDGITTNSTLYGNQVGPANPSMDFIQEVKVDMSGNSAEFSAPGYVSVITKGGTNDFHGSAYWYYNTAGLNARNFFQSRVGFAVLNDYGFTFSGPVFKNKTFFSGGLEAFNQHTGAALNLNLPSNRLRNGDFSMLRNSQGNPINITDPLTGQPFPGNVIPSNRLNQTALKIQERFFPLANFGDPESVVGNYRDQFKQRQRKEQVDVRIDHQFSSSNAFFGRFNAMRAPNNALEGSLPTIGLRKQRRQTRNLVLSDTHTFRPTVINEFRFGLIRGYNPYSGPVLGREIASELGLTGLPSDLPDVEALPIISISGFQGISQLDYQRGAEMIFQWQDNLSWIVGRHTIKMGGEVWHNYGENFGVSPSRAYGSISFTGNYSGHAYADLLLGIPRSASRSSAGFVLLKSTNWDKFLFIQDDFKATPRLTLNFGLRYELNPPYVETEDRLASFNPFTAQMVVPTEASKSALFPAFVSRNLVPIVTAEQAGLPTRTLAYTDKNNFAPRVGFAYKVTSDNKTVLRGGYGIFYDTFTAALWRSLVGGPYNGSESTPPNSITNGNPLWQLPAIFPAQLNQSGTASLGGVDPHMKNPYVQQWNLTIEREIFDMGLRASYVGTKTHQLVLSRNLNQVIPSTIPFSTSRRPFPQLSGATWRDNSGNAYYNGLTLAAERRLKKGLQYQLSYTWAKNLTDNHNEWEGGGGLQNAYDRHAEWANHQYTRRHRFIASAIWELPFGKADGWKKHLIEGWSWSTFAVLQTGPYFTPTFAGFDPSNTGASSGRPDRIGSGEISSPTIGQWFDVSAFRVPGDTDGDRRPDIAVGRFGNSGLNILRAPGTKSMNMGFFKKFPITETMGLQMEATFTNIFNHPNFAAPDSLITSGSAGAVLAVQSLEGAGARTTRLGLRLDF